MTIHHPIRPFTPMLAAIALLLPAAGQAQPAAVPPVAQHDGAHDFDFLLGDWKAHVKRLPDRLVGSTAWIEYDGISRHHPVLGSSANFEEFEVDSPSAPPGARLASSRFSPAGRRSVSTAWGGSMPANA